MRVVLMLWACFAAGLAPITKAQKWPFPDMRPKRQMYWDLLQTNILFAEQKVIDQFYATHAIPSTVLGKQKDVVAALKATRRFEFYSAVADVFAEKLSEEYKNEFKLYYKDHRTMLEQHPGEPLACNFDSSNFVHSAFCYLLARAHQQKLPCNMGVSLEPIVVEFALELSKRGSIATSLLADLASEKNGLKLNTIVLGLTDFEEFKDDPQMKKAKVFLRLFLEATEEQTLRAHLNKGAEEATGYLKDLCIPNGERFLPSFVEDAPKADNHHAQSRSAHRVRRPGGSRSHKRRHK